MNSRTGLESATKVGQGCSNLGVGARERSGGRRSDTKGLHNGRGGKETRKLGERHAALYIQALWLCSLESPRQTEQCMCNDSNRGGKVLRHS